MVCILILLLLVSVVLVWTLIIYNNSRHVKLNYKLLKIMLDNLHTYVFLVNENVGVEETNYYALNPEAKRDQPMVLGNVLRCKNGCDSGLCGTSPFCSMCTIRQHISKAFQAGKDFNNVESHMQLYTPDHNVVDTDVVVSGKYVMINDKPHLVVDVKDVTQEKMLENLYIEEKEKSFLDVKRLRGVLEKLASNITSPFNTLNGYVDMFKKAKTEEERLNSAYFIDTQSTFIKNWFDDFFHTYVFKELKGKPEIETFANPQNIMLPYVALITNDEKLSANIKGYIQNKYKISIFKDVKMLIETSFLVSAVVMDLSSEKYESSIIELRSLYSRLPIIIIASIGLRTKMDINDNYIYYIDKEFTQQELLRSLDAAKMSSIS
jgi:hypothetical protein